LNKKTVEIEKAIKTGWQVFKENPGLLIGIVLIQLIAPYLFDLPAMAIANVFETSIIAFVIGLVLNLLALSIDIIIAIGVINIALGLAKNRDMSFKDLFVEFRMILNFIRASILFALAVLVGLILLIIPGVIIAIALGSYPYFIIDENKGPMEALKASYALTLGAKWQLFVFGMLQGLIVIAGLLALLVGYFVALPITMVASAAVYLQLKTQMNPQETEVVAPQ